MFQRKIRPGLWVQIVRLSQATDIQFRNPPTPPEPSPIPRPVYYEDPYGYNMHGMPGDYLIQFPCGRQMIIDQVLFKTLFEPEEPRAGYVTRGSAGGSPLPSELEPKNVSGMMTLSELAREGRLPGGPLNTIDGFTYDPEKTNGI